ncbi:G5 domain-containing protein [Candidatus Dojkabacteria bacterium]|nr:G5 domain-containing protein [Candidatus Dojkabacteria bacterium]
MNTNKKGFGTRTLQIALYLSFVTVPILVLPHLSFAYASEDIDSKSAYENINSVSNIVKPQANYQIDPLFAPKHITVTYKGETYEGLSYGKEVKDALKSIGIDADNNLESNPPKDTILVSGMNIYAYDLVTEVKAEYSEIGYETKHVYNDQLEIDTTQVVQAGRKGKVKMLYEYLYLNGILKSKVKLSEETIEQTQDEIIAIGTMKVFRQMSINGDSFSYWKKTTVWATSYDSNCAGCNNITATGAILQKGVCAVDPTVIPLYTRMYIPGYGYCQALDTGGAIKGNKIDLGYDDLAKYQGQWSARYVEIYILD